MNRLRTGVFAIGVGFGAVLLSAQGGGEQGSAVSGYYGADQARRGKAVYDASCATCHTLERGAAMPAKIPLAGSEIIARWRTVGDLFSKVRRTMPANDANGLTDQQYLDVVAFVLQTNGFAAGKALTADAKVLHGLVTAKRGAGKVAVNNLAAASWYTEEQARRGEGYFRGNCMTCHTTNPDGKPTPAEAATGHRGGMLGGPSNFQIRPINAQGARRWPNVWSLYNKISQTMPAHDPGGLSRETYADIAAYLLKIYGVPVGSEELNVNPTLMRSMMLDEPGFRRLFNGKDFSGIKFVLGAQCTPKPGGCAQVEPKGAFDVNDGTIISTGSPEGYWYADARYLNFILRFDFRYLPISGLESDSDLLTNSGYLLFITEHGVWPKCMEIQGGASVGLFGAFGVGAQVKATSDNEARMRAIHPVGQWNSAEIVSKDGKVTTFLNGVLITTVSEHEFKEPGYIGFQSEGGQIQWRNIRIKPE